jgi:lipoprotein-releasing system permease protein
VPQVLELIVSGVIKIGMHEYDSKYAFASLPWVQEIFGATGKASTFKIKLKKGAHSNQASKRLSEVFGYPFRAKDWTELNSNLFYAIQLEKVVISIILLAIILVAAFNVVSTLMMMIHDKTKEIAILKAMGFKASQSFKLFCLVGMGIGIVGTAAGVGLGLAISWILDQTQLISLPSDIYYIGFLPVLINWREIGLIAGSAIIITFFATVYPAIRVSTQSPMNGIRYE